MGHATPAGNDEFDMLLESVCKLIIARFPYELARLSTDIAGGLEEKIARVKGLLDIP